MSMIERLYKRYVRPRVFKMSKYDPEIAHEWGMKHLCRVQDSVMWEGIARSWCAYSHPLLKTRVMGLEFPNPFGLAAGFDKYCEIYSRAVPAFGWGFSEVGGITRYRQNGNDRPRMWRSENPPALCNFMGFNNPGADEAAERIAGHPPTRRVPVGLNVGKSKITPISEAVEDYCYTVRMLWPYVDFITINPSSPNTPGLRSLQNKDALRQLIRGVQEENSIQARSALSRKKPVGGKISPDESEQQLDDIAEVFLETAADFLILTNTTTSRPASIQGLGFPPNKGGVSGYPLRELSESALVYVFSKLQGRIPIISVGGISSGDDLYDRIRMGASLCQAYTAWPFEGPDFARQCLKTLVRRLRQDGFQSVSEAVGTWYD